MRTTALRRAIELATKGSFDGECAHQCFATLAIVAARPGFTPRPASRSDSSLASLRAEAKTLAFAPDSSTHAP
jgi:hypothetical protein